MSAADPMPGTQAIRRAVAMLEAFTDERPSWNVSDLAQEIQLNRTTAYRLLAALEHAEYVRRDPATDNYRLGSGLIALGGRAQRANPVRAVALPELEALALESGETATLEILSGPEVVIIEEIPGDYVTSANRHIGSRWPVYATSTGKAILADLPPDALRAILAQPIRPLTAKTIRSAKQLRDCLADVRRQGYAVADEELELGFVAVGAPLRDATGQAVAAISLGGTRARLTDDRVAEIGAQVKAAAERVSHLLGYRG